MLITVIVPPGLASTSTTRVIKPSDTCRTILFCRRGWTVIAIAPRIVIVTVGGHIIVHVSGCQIPTKCSRVENTIQWFGTRRRCDLSSKKLFCIDRGIIEFTVGIPPFNQDGAFKGDTGKKTLGLTVGEDRGDGFEVCGSAGFGVTAYGACGDGEVAAEGDTAELLECFDGGVVIQDHDEIGYFGALSLTGGIAVGLPIWPPKPIPAVITADGADQAGRDG